MNLTLANPSARVRCHRYPGDTWAGTLCESFVVPCCGVLGLVWHHVLCYYGIREHWNGVGLVVPDARGGMLAALVVPSAAQHAGGS